MYITEIVTWVLSTSKSGPESKSKLRLRNNKRVECKYKGPFSKYTTLQYNENMLIGILHLVLNRSINIIMDDC